MDAFITYVAYTFHKEEHRLHVVIQSGLESPLGYCFQGRDDELTNQLLSQ